LYENPRSWLDAVHPEDRAWLQKLFSKPIPDRGYEHTYRILRPDGSLRWVLESGVPVKDNAGRFYRLAGIARDITRRKEMEIEMLAISEREQRRLGQDLHDDLCQQLVGIEFLSKAFEQQLAPRPEAAKAAEIACLIRAAIDRARHLARGLVPLEAEPEGLMRALKGLSTRTSEIFCVSCAFECPSPVLISEATTASYLYRIAQEAVTNSIKHGHANQIEIGLTRDSDSVSLTINDNGVGFSTEQPSPHGLGLNIMRYRTDMIGGQLTIDSAVEGGTRVTSRVHMPKAKLPLM
jgi:signal transduction histidine kinase